MARDLFKLGSLFTLSFASFLLFVFFYTAKDASERRFSKHLNAGRDTFRFDEMNSLDDTVNKRHIHLKPANGIGISDLVDGQTLEQNSSQPMCETIHIAIVCDGYSGSKDLASLAKSLLFHRKNPIHLHLIADEIAMYILSVLFDTWDVPYLNVSFYGVEELKTEVEYIPNTHYSGVYGMLKLVVPNILPSSVEKVILLDTHVTCSMDVADLWKLISTFSNKQAIGVVENQNDWYLGEVISNPWPALGKGFNTGVMAMDLRKLRSINWDSLWRSVANENLVTFYGVHLGDQDIVNAVITKNPLIVYRLPCVFNLQLSENTQSERCHSKINANKMIINWNSPSRQNFRHNHTSYFREVYNTFERLDGNLLRKPQVFCSSNHLLMNESTYASDFCSELKEVRNAKYRTHLFYLPFVAASNHKFDVTWVSQMSFDRIQMIEPLFRSWKGPISLALYLTDTEVETFQEFILQSEYLSSRTNVGYHIVYKQGSFHVINLLRNVALEQAHTPFVFLSDIDFLPVSNLYTTLKRAVEDYEVGFGNKALVIPAFENLSNVIKTVEAKEDVIELTKRGDLSSFDSNDFPPAHAPTNFAQWKITTHPYQIKWAPYFEPYIVVRQDVTRYDLRFAGYGWNKSSHILELQAQNYTFIVLPDSFIVHQPHSRGLDNLKFLSSPEYRNCCVPIKSEFARDLMTRYQYQLDEEAFHIGVSSMC